MQYRSLGNSGLKISVISLGAWVTFGKQIDEDQSYLVMKEAYDAGVNFFDNAEAYAQGIAEITMGNVIQKAGWKRSDLIISTKIFWGGDGPNDSGLSRKHIIEGTDKALKRLKMDYVDLIFCHRPDIHTPIEETVWAMNHILNQGKAFYWGTSEWSAYQILEAYNFARQEHLVPPLMEQPQYHMFHRERFEKEYAPLYKSIGLGTTIWSPLAGGLLTGKYNNGIPEGTRSTLEGLEWTRRRYESEEAFHRIEKIKLLEPLTQELNCTMAQLALAWVIKNPNVSTAITGASNPKQVVENLKALDLVNKLTDDVMERIEIILDNKPEEEQDWR